MVLSDGLYRVNYKGICAGFVVKGGRVKRTDCAPILRRNLKFWARIATLVGLVWLAGCATIRPMPVTLPLPPRPVLTPVTASQVQCLAPDTYTALVNRERALRTWGLELEAIIRASNGKAGK